MADAHGKHVAPDPPDPPDPPDTTIGDRDIQYGAVYKFAVGLIVVIIVSMGLMWAASIYLKKQGIQSDPAPSPLAEANEKRLPPEPRLEKAPPKDLAELRAREDEILSGYAWVNKEQGLARIPVARALDIVAEKGLPPAPGAK
jgi:hypothetical protein